MIGPEYVRAMAAYNRWQNEHALSAADALDDAARRLDRGAFFGSIHATLNHVLWGDQVWMYRLASTPKPAARSIADSLVQHTSWDDFKEARHAFDQVLIAWSSTLDPSALTGDLEWSSAASGGVVRKPRWLLVTHMFNHQTHHRGQVHAMLTAAGANPGPTDLSFAPPP